MLNQENGDGQLFARDMRRRAKMGNNFQLHALLVAQGCSMAEWLSGYSP